MIADAKAIVYQFLRPVVAFHKSRCIYLYSLIGTRVWELGSIEMGLGVSFRIKKSKQAGMNIVLVVHACEWPCALKVTEGVIPF